MPILVEQPIIDCSEDEFYAIDQKVRGIAFDIHNQFGRFFDEQIYQTELAARCTQAGLHAAAEVKISVTHGTFEKEYFLDLLINNKVIVELKTSAQITAAHRAQTLNYLLLCNLQHGSLLNFRPSRVKHKFVSCRQTSECRKNAVIRADHGCSRIPQTELLATWLRELISDWGAGLDAQLYRDAISHLLGGNDAIFRPIPVLSAGKIIGTQKMHMLTDTCSFALTSVSKDVQNMEKHFYKVLHSSNLEGMVWINLHRQHISIRFLGNPLQAHADTHFKAPEHTFS
ncbi:MAG TPA: GxxExxY protein [Prosthecobacter sp.]